MSHPVQIEQQKINFINKNIQFYSVNEFSLSLDISPYLVNKTIKSLGLKKKVVRRCDVKHIIGDALEDYFANNMSIVNISKKYNLSHYTLSAYISKMFFVRMDEDCHVITKESKINM